MIIKSISAGLLLAFCLCFFSCATIIRGSNQKVIILSQPKVANLEIDGVKAGQTPYMARLERRKKHVVKITLDGYNPYEITLNRKLNGWIFGNLLLGGIIGIVVDVATGSMYSLTPRDVYGELGPQLNTRNKSSDEILLTMVLKPDPTWTKIGQLEVQQAR